MARVWNIRLSEEDRQLLQAIARAKSMSQPEVIRGLVRQYHQMLRREGKIK